MIAYHSHALSAVKLLWCWCDWQCSVLKNKHNHLIVRQEGPLKGLRRRHWNNLPCCKAFHLNVGSIAGNKVGSRRIKSMADCLFFYFPKKSITITSISTTNAKPFRNFITLKRVKRWQSKATHSGLKAIIYFLHVSDQRPKLHLEHLISV